MARAITDEEKQYAQELLNESASCDARDRRITISATSTACARRSPGPQRNEKTFTRLAHMSVG